MVSLESWSHTNFNELWCRLLWWREVRSEPAAVSDATLDSGFASRPIHTGRLIRELSRCSRGRGEEVSSTWAGVTVPGHACALLALVLPTPWSAARRMSRVSDTVFRKVSVGVALRARRCRAPPGVPVRFAASCHNVMDIMDARWLRRVIAVTSTTLATRESAGPLGRAWFRVVRETALLPPRKWSRYTW